MGLIVRTAGLSRTKTEIKRDFDYLARLWDEIRERTLGSTAPALIYRDSDLIKRAIRDLYHREIEEVDRRGRGGLQGGPRLHEAADAEPRPAGEAAHRHHARCSSAPASRTSCRAMYQPVVQLKSGGYLVINPTEALVSIDINSGRSTREHNIEQTASTPTSKPRRKSRASCACATWPAWSSSTSSTWNRTAMSGRSRRR